MKTILITGGSGMIGRRLTKLLKRKGYNVIWLSRQRDINANIPRYGWNILKGQIDEEALEKADVIVHLAGVGIADSKWTDARKRMIIESRVRSAKLILEKLQEMDTKVDAFISASAVGYYGSETTDKIFVEDDKPANDFLGKVCQKWEEQAELFTTELGIRSVSIRTGVVLSENSDLIKKAVLPTKFWLGAPLGKGSQYMPWIDIDDLCEIYVKAIEDETMTGAYNAVAPEYTTNAEFMKAVASVLKKPMFLPPVPEFVFKMYLGEASQIILEGSRISSQKIQDAGYDFKYNTLKDALRKNLFGRKNENEKKDNY
ncbi:MAG TPA: TIGR01777 family protein [Bacteroidales bacterium]|nr:TIGR01777 family protein [Bacteroidales bacterium]